MKADSLEEESRQWQAELSEAEDEKYCLRLYVTGSTPKSIRAIANVKQICEKHLKGRYTLEVVDIYQQPLLARGEQIIAAPTLIKKLPLPLRKFIGDMTDSARILVGLDLRAVRKPEEAHGKPGQRAKRA